jgi:hypothetical protein
MRAFVRNRRAAGKIGTALVVPQAGGCPTHPRLDRGNPRREKVEFVLFVRPTCQAQTIRSGYAYPDVLTTPSWRRIREASSGFGNPQNRRKRSFPHTRSQNRRTRLYERGVGGKAAPPSPEEQSCKSKAGGAKLISWRSKADRAKLKEHPERPPPAPHEQCWGMLVSFGRTESALLFQLCSFQHCCCAFGLAALLLQLCSSGGGGWGQLCSRSRWPSRTYPDLIV